MRKSRIFFAVFFFSFICSLATAQLFVQNAPVVTNVDEGLEIGSKLGQIVCAVPTPAPSNFKYKVTLLRVTPLVRCGSAGQCFSIRSENDGSRQPSYNIFHYPFENNRLNYAEQNTYNLTFICEDQDGNRTDPKLAEVRVVPNMLPSFVTKSGESVTRAASELTAGTLVFTVSAQDPENNRLTYRMVTRPDQNNFFMDPQTGQIRVEEGFENLCNGTEKYNFQVFVKDDYHEEITPIAVELKIDYPAEPTLIGANQEVEVRENDPVGRYFHSFSVDQGTLAIDASNPIVPASMASKFTLQGDVLRIKEQFNFEEASRGNVSLVVTNGVCRKFFYLEIRVRDENDPPKLFPKTQTRQVEEGFIRVDTQTFVDDEDVLDTHTYKITKALIGSDVVIDRFSIDSNGQITSNADFDLDANKLDSQAVNFEIEVTDSQGSTDTAQLTLIITNANDNKPIITNTDIENTFMDCDLPRLIETIKATDADIGNNGQVIFTPTSSGPLSVTATGNVYLTSSIAAGSTHQLVVFAEDLGNPPQESNKPATVVVRGIPCTTTTSTTQPTTIFVNVSVSINNTNTGSSSGSDASSGASAGASATAASSAGFFDDPANLAWVIILALLLLLLLPLLFYLLWRFCFPRCCPGVCGSGGEGGCCDCCRKPRIAEGPVRGKGDIHDFWQEHYQEQDYVSTYHRSTKPTPAPHELGYLRNN